MSSLPRRVWFWPILLLVVALTAVAVVPGTARGKRGASRNLVTTTFAVFGDVNNSASDTPAGVFTSVCDAVSGSGASAFLSTGDALNDVADTSVSVAASRWTKYLGIETTLLGSGTPIWRACGDNDRVDLSARLSAYNQANSYLPTSPDPERHWYSRDIGGVHVIVLNSAYASHMGFIGYVSESSTSNSTEAKWLVSDLQTTAAKDGPSSIVVVSHYPLINGKSDKPYSGTRKPEAVALQALFAEYGVDMVVAGDTHVCRRTMVTVNLDGLATYTVPYVQIPPAASNPRSFGVSPIPSLSADEAGWAPGSSYRGFVTIGYVAGRRRLSLNVWKVAVSGGAVSSAESLAANANALGGTFVDVPEGCTPGVASGN